jgi:K+ transporter
VVVHRVFAAQPLEMRAPAVATIKARIGDVGKCSSHRQMANPGGPQVKPFSRNSAGFGALTAPWGGRKPSPPPVPAAFGIMAPDDTSPSPSPQASAAIHASNGGDGTSPVKAAAAAMVVGALGVVFGDIGTSPLYTFANPSRTARA